MCVCVCVATVFNVCIHTHTVPLPVSVTDKMTVSAPAAPTLELGDDGRLRFTFRKRELSVRVFCFLLDQKHQHHQSRAVYGETF